jgi:hypothetical protein
MVRLVAASGWWPSMALLSMAGRVPFIPDVLLPESGEDAVG